MIEDWRAIPGYEGWYEASSEGRVRAIQCPRRGHGRYFSEPLPIVLTPLEYRKGYTKHHLGSCNGLVECKRDFVHRIIYQTFHGPIPEGVTINHKDGNKRNNRPENLELATHAEQHAHARRLGLMATRTKQGLRQMHLTADDVRRIRVMWASGNWKRKHIAALFDIAPSNVRWIIMHRTWKHIR